MTRLRSATGPFFAGLLAAAFLLSCYLPVWKFMAKGEFDFQLAAECLLVAVLSLEGIVAVWHLREARLDTQETVKATKLQAFNDVLREISHDDVRNARRWVLRANLPEDPLKVCDMSEEDQEKARRVAVAYDRVGFFVKYGLFTGTEFFDWQGKEIATLWSKLRPIVLYIQETEVRPDYCKNFEYLGTVWLKEMAQKTGRPI